ncbi:hypothetical protein LTS18_000672, partial [Coniosporium uncinatum]
MLDMGDPEHTETLLGLTNQFWVNKGDADQIDEEDTTLRAREKTYENFWASTKSASTKVVSLSKRVRFSVNADKGQADVEEPVPGLASQSTSVRQAVLNTNGTGNQWLVATNLKELAHQDEVAMAEVYPAPKAIKLPVHEEEEHQPPKRLDTIKTPTKPTVKTPVKPTAKTPAKATATPSTDSPYGPSSVDRYGARRPSQWENIKRMKQRSFTALIQPKIKFHASTGTFSTDFYVRPSPRSAVYRHVHRDGPRVRKPRKPDVDTPYTPPVSAKRSAEKQSPDQPQRNKRPKIPSVSKGLEDVELSYEVPRWHIDGYQHTALQAYGPSWSAATEPTIAELLRGSASSPAVEDH